MQGCWHNIEGMQAGHQGSLQSPSIARCSCVYFSSAAPTALATKSDQDMLWTLKSTCMLGIILQH